MTLSKNKWKMFAEKKERGETIYTRIRKKLKEKLIYRLCFILFISICIPLILFSYVSYMMSYRSMTEQFKESKNNLDTQVAENVESNFYALKNQSIALYDYDSIAYILRRKKLCKEHYYNLAILRIIT